MAFHPRSRAILCLCVATLLGGGPAVGAPLSLPASPAPLDETNRREVVFRGEVNVWDKNPAARFTVGLGADDGFISCSAVLVAPDVLLTAAHCVSNTTEESSLPREPGQVMAYFVRTANSGQAAAQMKVEKIKAVRIEVHPQWIEMQSADFLRRTTGQISVEYPLAPATFATEEFLRRWTLVFDHDLALVKLERAAPAGFLTAELPTDDAAGENCRTVISGFGRDEATYARGKQGIRAGVSGAVIPEGFSGGRHFRMGDGPGAPRAGMCKGDSGGPLLELCAGRVRVLGVASRFLGQQLDCGKPGTEFMYAKTFNAREWLVRTMEIVNSSPTGK